MYIQFDPKNIHVQIICGSLESYTPTEKIREIQEKTSNLKKIVEKFMSEVVDPGIKEIQKMVKEENDRIMETFKKEKSI